jgi:hypothetical protein
MRNPKGSESVTFGRLILPPVALHPTTILHKSKGKKVVAVLQ